jgi:hypothetical protein
MSNDQPSRDPTPVNGIVPNLGGLPVVTGGGGSSIEVPHPPHFRPNNRGGIPCQGTWLCLEEDIEVPVVINGQVESLPGCQCTWRCVSCTGSLDLYNADIDRPKTTMPLLPESACEDFPPGTHSMARIVDCGALTGSGAAP